jgi:hypothetical protein
VNLEGLSLAGGGLLLVKRALRALSPGESLELHGHSPTLALDARAYCRAQGHAFTELGPSHVRIERGRHDDRRSGAVRAGTAAVPVEAADVRWGLAARGALVEPGGPELSVSLTRKSEVWADEVGRLYAQGAAAQWNPATAIAWGTRVELPSEVEDAVVQVMTYLVENETAALVLPASFLARLHPHFREVMQVLALQAADEARHMEVFTRRALLNGRDLGLSTVGGRASLQTLLTEPDFASASFLLSVLGEGSFLPLLAFLRRHAPDPVTREVVMLAGQDEARHVAFGLAHLERHAQHEPALRPRLAAAVERRHAALAQTAGLNEEVYDALTLIAAGSFEPAAVERGALAVQALLDEMHRVRSEHLARLGFTGGEAETLSSLHTRNFM